MIMVKKIIVLAVFAALSAPDSRAVAGPVGLEIGANLVTNGGFETGNLNGWTRSGNPDTVFTGVDCFGGCLGNFAFDSGAQTTLAFINQTISTVPGRNYNIHFFLQSDGEFSAQFPNEIEVDFAGKSAYHALNIPAQPFTEIVIDSMAASTSTDLRFGLRSDSGFLQLDNISVRLVQQIPEPAALALTGLGLIAFGWSRRRSWA